MRTIRRPRLLQLFDDLLEAMDTAVPLSDRQVLGQRIITLPVRIPQALYTELPDIQIRVREWRAELQQSTQKRKGAQKR